MAEYEFNAESATGEPVKGTLFADNEQQARAELELRGLRCIDLLWCPVVDESGVLGDAELTTIVHAVGSAAVSRVPLEATLAVLAEDKDNRRLAAVAQRLSERVSQGVTIDDAINEYGDKLPPELMGLMRAGIDSGDLAGSFERFTTQRMASQRVGRKIQSAIAYPIVVIGIMVPILLFLSLYVIPMFGEMFEDFGLDLPGITLMILQTGEQMPGLIVGLLIIVFVVPIALRILGGRWLLHRFRSAIPLFGRPWMWSGQREFAAMLASFLELRLPLARAVECTGQLMGDRNVAQACRRVSERLQTGETLSASMSASISFDRTLTSMVAWGEDFGMLPDALRIASEVYEDRIDQYLGMIRRLLPPLALIAVGSMSLFVVIGLFLPMIKLIEGLSS